MKYLLIFIGCFCLGFVNSCLQVNAQCANPKDSVHMVSDQSEEPKSDATVDNSDTEQEVDVEN